MLLSVALILPALSGIPSVRAETSIPKPAVPQFTVQLVDHSYDVPATASIDPYTGQTVNHPAHHVENYTIDVTIKNPPLVEEDTADFYYNVRVKGHFAENWINLYMMGEGPTLSKLDSTVISYQLIPTQPDQGYTLANSISGLPPNSQLDFQVEAMSGYWSRTTEFASQHFTAQESGWSNTQTITIPESTPTGTATTSPTVTPQETPVPTQSGSQTATVLGLGWGEFAIIVLLSVIAVLLVIVIVYLRKRSTKST